MLFTVSDPKHSDSIQFGGKGKGIQFFTSRYDPMGFSLLDQVSERAFFSRSLDIFFFSNYIMAKKAEAFQKNLEII